jgi:hypothetical protein
MVGAQPLHKLAQALEAQAAAGALGEVQAGLAELRRMLDRFLRDSASW